MKKIWIRLGGFISADENTMNAIMKGDEDALIKAIKEHGFEVNGESYIPLTPSEDVIGSFELGVLNLVADGI